MQVLDQQRLDVADKTRSNIFGWRGQFTPQFVEYLLDQTGAGAGLVVDPFCGSGTVLRECAGRNRSALGFEINPAAYAMSRFFTLCRATRAERLELVAGVERVLRSVLGGFGDLPLFNPSGDYRSRARNLLDLAREIFAKAESKRQTLLLLLILLEAEGSRGADLEGAVSTAAARVRRHLLQLPCTTAVVEALLGDARLSHCHIRGNASLVLTSPPYVNVFNYHQNHRALLELLGFDLLQVAGSEIGSNRRNRQNRFRTVVQYALDMEQCLESFALSLATGGRLVLVVGRESNVRGLSIPNSGLVRVIADHLRAFEHENTFERRFTNRFGASIYEDILVLRRTDSKPMTGSSRASALALLEEISPRATGEVLADVRGAIRDGPSIGPSPLFMFRFTEIAEVGADFVHASFGGVAESSVSRPRRERSEPKPSPVGTT